MLSDKKVPWAVYAGDLPQTSAYVELGDAFKDRFNRIDEFFEDVQDGTLPAHSLLGPRHFVRVDSQHPVHSVALGDQLLRRVYTALSLNPEIWESLLFIVTWDEHGGFMDRIRPEKTLPPFPGKTAKNEFAFDILGVRVPAIVISPLIPKETVDDSVYDHSSIPATVSALFGLDEHLTKRDEAAHTVLPLLTLDEKASLAVLPPTKPGRLRRAVAGEAAPEEPVELDDLQRSLIELTRQLDGHRRHLRRATPPVVEELPDAMTPAEIDLVVTHFQYEHLGSRERRMAQEA
jgi:phospholipase C